MSPAEPDSPPQMDREALLRQAGELYDSGELEAAARGFGQLLALDPGHVLARYRLANALNDLGRLPEALVHYQALLAREPRHAEGLNNLGAVHQALGQSGDAESCYRRAIESKPDLAPPYLNLGRLLQNEDRLAEAAQVCRAALDQGMDEGLFGHLLAAIEGGTSTRAPASYVRETFDAFASGFEQRLATLGYQVPPRLVALARAHGEPDGDILDLGCGTGLVGAALGSRPRSLVGVDLSPAMLVEARAKGCYSSLHHHDIVEWLQASPPACFDLVVAADVFIYLGELEAVFREVRRVLRHNGLFAFSVESCEEGDYRLQPSGRYAQSPAYVGRLAERHGMALAARQVTEIRSGAGGALYLLRVGETRLLL